MAKSNTMIFHGRKNSKSRNRTHTLCIRNNPDNNELAVTWAKVFKGNAFIEADRYERAKGRELVLARMEKFETKRPKDKYRFESKHVSMEDNTWTTQKNSAKKFFVQHLPAVVGESLPWYLSCAKRYFRLDDAKVVIRGLEVKGAEVPHKVLIETTLNDAIADVVRE